MPTYPDHWPTDEELKAIAADPNRTALERLAAQLLPIIRQRNAEEGESRRALWEQAKP